MKRTTKHVKETAKPAQQPGYKTAAEFLASTGLTNPLAAALVEGAVRSVPPRGRPRTNRERDTRIWYLREEKRMTFGEIAHRLKIGREVVMSAYYRMKKQDPGK